MANERWVQIEHLFHVALESPVAERGALLAQQCAGDEELRREVESLLTEHEQPPSVFAIPAADLAADWIGQQSVAPLQSGALIGQHLRHYQILSVLGRGGMGEVYLAEDTQLDRRVALKLLPVGLTTDADRLRRFVREAKAVSALNHPNIITIHETGQTTDEGGTLHFLVTEYIEGETLRERMDRERLSLRALLDIALQLAAALSVAHEASIIHRDIKPENVMLRKDGIVKVLDFGLAKLTRRDELETNLHTSPLTPHPSTISGIVMGTPHYMSPEQARGQMLDVRSDIFSLGVMLYEMLAGRPPFDGATTLEVVGAILHEEPAPLEQHFPAVPACLKSIVNRTLCKDRTQRYQTSNDLMVDLRQAREELARQGRPESADRTPEAVAPMATTTAVFPAKPTRPSGKLVLGQVRAYVRRYWLPATLALSVTTALAIFFVFHRSGKPALTDKDTILLGGFLNRTGDEVFDGTLRQGLAVQLAQTPFLQLFSEPRIRETLQQMGRSPDELVTPEIGREICERHGLKAVIAGDIAALGNHYVLTLEAVSGPTGETLAREQIEAPAKEQVLQALSQSASNLRKSLGESLASVEKYSALLEATTSSLPALKAYTQGLNEHRAGKDRQAISFFQRAIELDQNFASAWAYLGALYSNTNQIQSAAESATRAFVLRERVSELERFQIMNWYYANATGEVEQRIEVLEQFRRTYPRSGVAPTGLYSCYTSLGQLERAADAAREALLVNPKNVVSYTNYAYALMRLGHLAESRSVLKQMEESLNPTMVGHWIRFQLASLAGDATGQQQFMERIQQQSDEYLSWQLRAEHAIFRGQWRQTQELTHRANELALRLNNRSLPAALTSQFALHSTLLSATTSAARKSQIASQIQESLALARDRTTLSNGGLAYALSGNQAQSLALQAELAQRYPHNTLINLVWLPILRATLALRAGQAAETLDHLRPVERYEIGAWFWPEYLRGQAYLQLRSGNEAAAEFRKITEHRSYHPLSPLWPLAQLGLARALALTGNTKESQKAYDTFFAFWKDADADLPILLEACREAAQFR